MRFIEFADGFDLPVSNEEHCLLEKIESCDGQTIARESLNGREIELARLLVSRGLVARHNLGGVAYYTSKSSSGGFDDSK